jgi:hypothetical protein
MSASLVHPRQRRESIEKRDCVVQVAIVYYHATFSLAHNRRSGAITCADVLAGAAVSDG